MSPRAPDPFKFVRSRRRTMTDAEICDTYRHQPDLSAEDLALQAGLSGCTVRMILKAAGITLHPRQGRTGPRKRLPPGVTDAMIADAYQAGASGPEVARRFGIVDDDVYRALVRSNVRRRDARWYRTREP